MKVSDKSKPKQLQIPSTNILVKLDQLGFYISLVEAASALCYFGVVVVL